jgi:hypothetical protein
MSSKSELAKYFDLRSLSPEQQKSLSEVIETGLTTRDRSSGKEKSTH